MQKKLEEHRNFGDEVMDPVGYFKVWHHPEGSRKEIWESQRRCPDKESAVRVEVLSRAGKIEHVTVSEKSDGKLFKTEFNSLLEPVGTTPDSEIVGEHREKLGKFLNIEIGGKGEFFKHAMGSLEDKCIVKVQGPEPHRGICIPKNLAMMMKLGGGMSGSWKEEGDSLVMAPLEETTLQRNIYTYSNSLVVAIPSNLLFVSGLKPDDYVIWGVEDGKLSLRKSERLVPDARKLWRMGKGEYGRSVGTSIPKKIANELGLKKGMPCFWTFGEDCIWLGFSKEKVNVVAINQTKRDYTDQFLVTVPQGMGEWMRVGDEAVLEVKEGKLYVRKKAV